MNYVDKLKDARWQEHAAKVKQRDGWTCQRCGAHERAVMVAHHWHYTAGIEPWEEPLANPETLCEICHTEVEERIRDLHEAPRRKNVARAVVRHGLPVRQDAGRFRVWLVANCGLPDPEAFEDQMLDIVVDALDRDLVIASGGGLPGALEGAARRLDEDYRSRAT